MMRFQSVAMLVTVGLILVPALVITDEPISEPESVSAQKAMKEDVR